MKLTYSLRFVYDDVLLVESTDPWADAWRLEVETDQASKWLPIAARIRDAHRNWSTSDLTHWDELRRGELGAVQAASPESGSVPTDGAPFAVTWDLSDWYHDENPTTGDGWWFRFTDPDGAVFTFQYQSLLGEREHAFGERD